MHPEKHSSPQMLEVWKRILSWHKANTPEEYCRLRSGASYEELQSVETQLGLELPDDIKSSCRIHDGQLEEGGIIGGEGWRLLPLLEITEIRERWIQANPGDRYYIPVAEGVMGDYVLLNLDPNSENQGSLMIQRKDSTESDYFMPSFASWLTNFADQLETGEFAYSEEDGCVMYADELDLD